MKYKIGTVAKLLGVSAETLRLYERNGILLSERDESENGYRYYDRLDITALTRARSYHQYGFFLREIQTLINTDDVQLISRKYQQRAEALEEEIRRKEQMLECLRQIQGILDRLPEELWTIRRAVSPGLYRMEFMKGEELILNPEQVQLFSQWVSLSPFVFPSQRNCWKSLEEGRDESFSALGILEEDAKRLGMPDFLACGTYHPPCPCLYTAVEIAENNASCVSYLSHVKDYIRQNGISVTGDPFCRTFLSMNKQKNYRRFRQIWIPANVAPTP